MVSLKNFARWVYRDAPGCSELYVLPALLDTISDFASQTWILTKAMSVDIADTDYDSAMNYEVTVSLTSIVGETPVYRPVGLVSLTVDNLEYPVRHVEAVNHSEYLADLTDYKMYYFSDHDEMILYPVTDACTLYLELAITPLSTVDEVADVFWDRWKEPIIAGTKAKLYRMPGQFWTNFDLVGVCERDYRRGVVDARRGQRKAFAAQTKYVQPRSDQVWI